MAQDDGVRMASSTGETAAGTATDKSVTLHLIKTGLDLFPLVVFFVANLLSGIFYATALCMAATVVSLLVSRLFLKQISVMALVTGAGVLIFGTLTIWLHNDLFVKIKPTIVNLLFASALLGGLPFNQLFVRTLLGEAIHLTEAGWRRLQWRWGLFFIFLALINEIARRNLTTEVWAASKFASFPLTFIFMLAQIGLLKQFAAAQADPATDRTGPSDHQH